MRRDPAHLGDSHNFGRRVTLGAKVVTKPRTLVWEWLILSAKSPLRRRLDEIAAASGLGSDAFGFLPDLAFSSLGPEGGDVERIELAPLPPLSDEGRIAFANVAGRALALFAWLGVSDLHWENLVLGADAGGRVVFSPIDVELVLADMELPTETKLVPEADPDVVDMCRHAAGLRRVLPFLGKPPMAEIVLAIASAYRRTLACLDRHASEIAGALTEVPELERAPIRVLLRGTDEYVRARSGNTRVWPPMLDAESAQLARGDIPYFFRVLGEPGIRWYGNEALTEIEKLPLRGDVPRLGPLLAPARGLRSKARKRLREEGLFTVLGAFDHKGLRGRHEAEGIAVTFRGRTLVLELDGEEMETRRDLGAFVASLYLPCSCGEVTTVFVPAVTQCEALPQRS